MGIPSFMESFSEYSSILRSKQTRLDDFINDVRWKWQSFNDLRDFNRLLKQKFSRLYATINLYTMGHKYLPVLVLARILTGFYDRLFQYIFEAKSKILKFPDKN